MRTSGKSRRTRERFFVKMVIVVSRGQITNLKRSPPGYDDDRDTFFLAPFEERFEARIKFDV